MHNYTVHNTQYNIHCTISILYTVFTDYYKDLITKVSYRVAEKNHQHKSDLNIENNNLLYNVHNYTVHNTQCNVHSIA